jgi:hypothetical protein
MRGLRQSEFVDTAEIAQRFGLSDAYVRRLLRFQGNGPLLRPWLTSALPSESADCYNCSSSALCFKQLSGKRESVRPDPDCDNCRLALA